MKIFAIILLILFGSTSIAQQKIEVYLELPGKIMLGSPYIDSFKRPSRLLSKADSLINFEEIEQLTKKRKDAISVINALALKGWSMVSVAVIPKDPEYVDKWHNTLIYYFKKEFSER